MEGIQIAAFAPVLVGILCVSIGNCCFTCRLRTTIQNLKERLYTLESARSVRQTPQMALTSTPQMALTSTPQMALTLPPHLPPLPQQYPQPPSYYYTQQFPTPSAPRTSTVI